MSALVERDKITLVLKAILRARECALDRTGAGAMDANVKDQLQATHLGLTLRFSMSPLAYHYQHRAEIESVVQSTDRDAVFDALTASVGAALTADRPLGGLCDWVEAEAPQPVDLPVAGSASLKAAVIRVSLFYATSDPLG